MDVKDFLKLNKIEIKDIKYKIVRIKEKQDFVLLYLDNDEKITISIEDYFKYSLNSNKGLNEDIYNQLKQSEILLKAYNSVLRKLSIKDYTTKQIKDYLSRNLKLEINNVNTIIDKLYKYKLLDDDKYCFNRFNYLNNSNLSIKQIKNKLTKEGISLDLIEKYAIINVEDEYSKASNLAQKYVNTIKNKSTNSIKQSILTKLVNNGYSYDMCKNIVNELDIKNEKEKDLLNKEFNKLLNKYSKKFEGYELNSRIYGNLIQKGFNIDDIKEVMEDNNG